MTPAQTAALRQVRRVRETREQLDATTWAAVSAAQATGVSMQRIADELGVARDTLYKLRERVGEGAAATG